MTGILDKRWRVAGGVGALALIFLVARLLNLRLAGLHYDEGVYLFCGQMVRADWAHRYWAAIWAVKQPLHSWLLALALELPLSPVVAGRLVSVVAGALTVWGMAQLGTELFSRRVGWIAAGLGAVCPYLVLYDRLGLIDSLLTAQATWLLVFTCRLAAQPGWPAALGLGFTWGAALLTKGVAMLFPLLLAFALAARPAPAPGARKWVWWVAGLVFGAVVYYAAFGHSEWAGRVLETQGQRHVTGTRLPWQQPVAFGVGLGIVVGQFAALFTPGLMVVAVMALCGAPWLGRAAWVLGAWPVLVVAGTVAWGKDLVGRYFLFCVPAWLVLTAHGLVWAWDRLPLSGDARRRRAVALAAGLVVAGPAMVVTGRLATDQTYANRQAGGFLGVLPASEELRARARHRPVTLIVGTGSGPVEDGLTACLWDVPNVQVLRAAPAGNALKLFAAADGRNWTWQELTGREVWHAFYVGREAESVFAGQIELRRRFASQREPGDDIGLYAVLGR